MGKRNISKSAREDVEKYEELLGKVRGYIHKKFGDNQISCLDFSNAIFAVTNEGAAGRVPMSNLSPQRRKVFGGIKCLIE